MTGAAYHVLTAVYGHWTMHALGFPADRAVAAREQARRALGVPPRASHRQPRRSDHRQ